MNWKLIAAGAGGLAVGAGAGWVAASQYYKKQFRGALEDAAQVNQKLVEKIVENGELKKEISRLTEPPVSEQVEELQASDDEEDDPDLDERNEEVKANLQELIEPYVSGEEPVDTFVSQGKRMIKTARQAPPEVISKELYAWDPDGVGDDYEKTTLTYYPRHRVLLDEDGDLVEAPNVDAMVGWKNLAQFGGDSGDPNIVFIRNHHLATDFEVEKIEDEDPPLHVQFGMPKADFDAQKAAGLLTFREDDV